MFSVLLFLYIYCLFVRYLFLIYLLIYGSYFIQIKLRVVVPYLFLIYLYMILIIFLMCCSTLFELM